MRVESTQRGELRDATLRAGWRGVVLTLIFTLTLVACSMGYQTLLAILAVQWATAGIGLAIALAAGGAVAWLCAHRGDLIEL